MKFLAAFMLALVLCCGVTGVELYPNGAINPVMVCCAMQDGSMCQVFEKAVCEDMGGSASMDLSACSTTPTCAF